MLALTICVRAGYTMKSKYAPRHAGIPDGILTTASVFRADYTSSNQERALDHATAGLLFVNVRVEYGSRILPLSYDSLRHDCVCE
jgi:hypothetical protein